ncbi:Stromal cell-derived factor 2-like protein [Hibiscus syriacus]|uniref:Stromal cell-derived factor 2-like protein n=1 Tax=Hibiscus syriacus TaxID=106335 RepID=A0A6A3CZ72_HIBSY|nr:Stromal cell-derived factor 2-like protein [Hibiscus syriacus]
MAVGFFGLALFLFLSFDLDQGSPSSASASASASSPSQNVEVTYGTVLKLMHEKTKFRLHSHDVPYGSGSGQQSVTGFLILQHMRTRKWLHSHLHASPISGNLEVSCFGGESESDTGDYWREVKDLEARSKDSLQHVDTGGYLLSHDKKYSRIAGGQQEVCGVREKRADTVWLAAEGVYLPITEST